MRRSTLRLAKAGSALVIMGGVAVASASASPASTSAAKRPRAVKVTKMDVGILPVADAGGFFIAEARGYFREQHLAVTSSIITGGAALVPAIVSGSMTVGFSNLVSVLQAGAQNFGVQCLAGTLQKPASGHNLSLVVSPAFASKIKSAKDLDGQTIAVNTLANINQVVADAWLAANGANWRSVHYVAVDFPDMPAEIAKGQVTAAITDEPFTTISLKGGAKLLAARPYQVFAKTPVFSCWLASTRWITNHKAAAKAFVAALNESDAYLAKHRNYLRTILPRYTSLTPALANAISLSKISTKLSLSDLKLWQSEAMKFGVLAHPVANLSKLIAKLK